MRAGNGCPPRIRTLINGVRVRGLTIRRRGNRRSQLGASANAVKTQIATNLCQACAFVAYWLAFAPSTGEAWTYRPRGHARMRKRAILAWRSDPHPCRRPNPPQSRRLMVARLPRNWPIPPEMAGMRHDSEADPRLPSSRASAARGPHRRESPNQGRQGTGRAIVAAGTPGAPMPRSTWAPTTVGC